MGSQKVSDNRWHERVGSLVQDEYQFELVLDHEEGEVWFHSFNDRSCGPETLRDLAAMFIRAAELSEECL